MSILIYTFVLSFSVYFASKSNNIYIIGNKIKISSQINLFFSLTLITLLVGLRSENIGIDTVYYLDYYKYLPVFRFDNILLNYLEPGYSFIIYLLRTVHASETLFLLTNSTISLFLFFIFYKNINKQLPWAIFFAFSTGFIFLMMNGMRQAIAIPILALSIKYVTNRNLLKFLGVVLVGTLFHYSILLMLPIYLINYLSKIKYGLWGILFIISVFISPFNFLNYFGNVLSILPKDYSHYLNLLDLTESKFTVGFLFNLILGFLAIYFSSQITIDKFNKNILNIYFLGVILMNMTWQSALLQRFTIYFMFFQIPAFAFISFSLKKKNQIFSIILIISLFLFSFIYKIIVGDSGCSPYEFSF